MYEAFPLSAALAARVPVVPSAAAEDALQGLLRDGQQAWPGVALAPADFVAHLAELLHAERARAGPGGPAADELGLSQLNGRDLYLSCACSRGDPPALLAFEGTYLSQVPGLVRHVNASPAFLDEVCQVLRVNLLVGGPDGPPRIGEYAGRGALFSWLRIAAVRVAARLNRRRPIDGQGTGRRMEEAGVLDPMDALPAPELPPELLHVRARYQAEFKDALEQALSALPVQQRTVLRLQTVGGLNGEQIATLYKVTRSTVSRWLSSARAMVLAETQRRLQERLHLTEEEFGSLAGAVHSQLDLSLSRLLQAEPEQ